MAEGPKPGQRISIAGQDGFYDAIMAFYHAVDWTEPWIQVLLVAHVSIFIVVLLTRRFTNFQSVLFILLMALVYFAKSINEWGHAHWKEFAKFDYFDKNGAFMAVMYSGPILLNALVILINILLAAANLLILVKRAEAKLRVADAKTSGAAKTKKTQ